jgi:hypothetical protein
LAANKQHSNHLWQKDSYAAELLRQRKAEDSAALKQPDNSFNLSE